MYASSMRENRESPPDVRPMIKGGSLGEGQGRKPEMGGQSDSPVVPAKPANKPARGESRACPCGGGAGGGKGAGQGEHGERSALRTQCRQPRASRARPCAPSRETGQGRWWATSWMWCDRHGNPEDRLHAPPPRQEPSAVVPLAGICAGGRP